MEMTDFNDILNLFKKSVLLVVDAESYGLFSLYLALLLVKMSTGISFKVNDYG